MSITISITSNTAQEARIEMQALLGQQSTAPANLAPPEQVQETAAPSTPAPRRGRRSPPQTIDGTCTDVTPKEDEAKAEASDAKKMAIHEVREEMKKVANDGHMNAVSQALKEFNAAKVSDIDPAAGAEPSVRLAEFVARIQEIAKGATT